MKPSVAVPTAGWPPRSAYLHLPFCHRRCFYCDFPVVPLGDHADGATSASIATYLAWLEREIAAAAPGPALATAYFGGGTPSLCTPAQIGRLLETLRRRFGLMPGAEITLELDPASFDERRLEGYLAVGVNRVSLGGQSFDDAVLAGLGRRHRRQDLIEAAGWLDQARRRGALRSWSLDLIQGLPLNLSPQISGATRQARSGSPAPAPADSGARPAPDVSCARPAPAVLCQWRELLGQALALRPPHLSIYDLIVEPGTAFERWDRQGRLQRPDDDLAADLQALTQAELTAAGYGHYEISNYALPGHASRHNRVYWSGAAWWGFGMGATSGLAGERLARPRTREGYRQWLETTTTASDPHAPAVIPCGRFPLEDRLLVGLRRREGINLQQLWREEGLPPEWLAELAQRLQPCIEGDLLRLEGGRWRLTDPEGLALSNVVLRQILGWWQERVPPDGAAAVADR